MECIFDKEKLNKVLYDFYNSTGIAITLYDASEAIVATLPIHSACCSYIRHNQACKENCDRSNLTHIQMVWTDRKIRRYSCHAGIMEAILPIIYDGFVIAYLQIGQFRDSEQIYSKEENLSELALTYGFDKEILLEAYRALPQVSEKKLEAIENILRILIKSFWQDGLITCRRSMLSVKIEKYIEEHLTEKMYIEDICREFYLSKNALYKLFRDEFQTTVGDFITHMRLGLSLKLLNSNSDASISEIASACGFADYNYYIRLFKKNFGTTPLRYRKSGNSFCAKTDL